MVVFCYFECIRTRRLVISPLSKLKNRQMGREVQYVDLWCWAFWRPYRPLTCAVLFIAWKKSFWKQLFTLWAWQRSKRVFKTSIVMHFHWKALQGIQHQGCLGSATAVSLLESDDSKLTWSNEFCFRCLVEFSHELLLFLHKFCTANIFDAVY